MEKLIENFARMRLTIQANESPEESERKITAANALFRELYETWLLLDQDERAVFRRGFLRAQSDFHFMGARWIGQINPPVAFVRRRSTEGEQLRFGTLPNEPKAITNETTTQVKSASAAEVTTDEIPTTSSSVQVASAAELVASKSDTEKKINMEVDDDDSSDVSEVEKEVATTPKKDTESTVEKSCQSEKEQTAEQNAPKLITEVMQLSYASYAELLRPVLNLPLIIQVDVKSINDVIKAITDVTTMADAKRLKLHQSVIRTIILLVLAKFDSTSKLAWKYELGNNEPTFDFLVSFLCKRKKDEDVQSTAVKDWKIPKNVNPVNDKPSISGVATNKKAKNGGGVGRSITPSPVRNPYKKQKPSQNVRCPFGDGPHVLRECPKFIGMTLEGREAELHKRGWCINCLSPTHTVAMCLDGPCKICKKRHNSLLHHR